MRGSTGPEPARVGGRWPSVAATALLLALGIFLLYFLAYPVRHLTLPVGFDPPWYVWRAEHLVSQGIGTGDLGARPGYAVLSAVLGGVIGKPQLELTVLLPMVLVALVALAVGGFASEGLGLRGGAWVLVVAATGVVLGPTHLVGENLSNTLNQALETAALVPLAGAVGGGGGVLAAIALLVAAGLAHWDFLAIFAVVMAVTAAMSWRDSMARARRGEPLLATEVGVLVAAGAGTGAVMATLIFGVLRAPLSTVEIGQDRLLYLRKFRTDVTRLAVPEVVGLIAPWAFPFRRGEAQPTEEVATPRRFAVRWLRAWTYVVAAGIVLGALTLRVPPARFLALLVALPGALGVGWALWWIWRRVAGRRRRPVAAGVVVVVLGLLAIPGLLRWYRYPVLLDPAGVREARTAARYVGSALPPGRPVVFLVGYLGKPGSYATVVKERTILLALPPAHQTDARLYVGDLDDLLAGRRTPPPDPRTGRITQSYWTEVRPVLGQRPPIVAIRTLAGAGFEEVLAAGGREVAPDVAVLRGPAPATAIEAAPPVDAVPSWAAGLGWGAALLVLLAAVGGGWTLAVVRRGADAETVVSVAPVVGAAALVLGGLLAAELGVRLGRAGSLGSFVVVGLAGYAVALARRHRRA